MDAQTKTAILHAVDRLFDEEVEFLAELSRHPSTRGNEQSAQEVMAAALDERGYEVDRWSIRVEDIAHLPGFSPVIDDYADAVNVVGAHRSTRRSGRSLILNGHVMLSLSARSTNGSDRPSNPMLTTAGWSAEAQAT